MPRPPNTRQHAKRPQPLPTGLPSLTKPSCTHLLAETRLSICQAAARLPGSNGATTAARQTIGRWINRGVKLRDGSKLKLEAVLVGGKWWTSAEALDRFLEATTADRRGDEQEGPPVRTPAQRRRASEAAEKELIAMGL